MARQSNEAAPLAEADQTFIKAAREQFAHDPQRRDLDFDSPSWRVPKDRHRSTRGMLSLYFTFPDSHDEALPEQFLAILKSALVLHGKSTSQMSHILEAVKMLAET